MLLEEYAGPRRWGGSNGALPCGLPAHAVSVNAAVAMANASGA